MVRYRATSILNVDKGSIPVLDDSLKVRTIGPHINGVRARFQIWITYCLDGEIDTERYKTSLITWSQVENLEYVNFQGDTDSREDKTVFLVL